MRNVIKLKLGEWAAQISPVFGMNTIMLSCGGEQILRSPESLDALQASPCTYGTPLLLPPNRTRNAQFEFDGKTYLLTPNEKATGNHIHGFLNSALFEIEEWSDDRAVGKLINDGAYFPFPFEITVTCQLSDDGYTQKYSIKNTGDTDMPLTIGLHTTFFAKDQFCVPIGQLWQRDSANIPTGILLPLSKAEEQYRKGTPCQGNRISGFYTSAGNTARIGNYRYTVSSNFNQWILWNGDGNSGFISIEPQCGAVNALNSQIGLHRLEPGEIETFTTWIHGV